MWIPVDPTTYQVTLSAMKVGKGGHTISNFGHTMVDSGTTYTFMGSKTYQALRSGIEDYCRKHKSCGAGKQGQNCWTLPGLYKGRQYIYIYI